VIKAIETSYKGCRFRSRLEARWAVLLDNLGTEWRYESQGFDLGEAGRYLPDFFLPKHDLWLEIKGEEPDADDERKMRAFRDAGRNHVLLTGDIPSPGEQHTCDFHRAGGDMTWFEDRPIKISVGQPMELFCVAMVGRTWEGCPEDGNLMECPFCGFDYVHFSAPEHKESDDYSAWKGRGGAIRIPMWCEGGHAWDLRFGFHKGNTLLAIENGRDTGCSDLSWWLAGWDAGKRDIARAAARSARFEHGECG
jgi:hypothetical protein